MSQQGTGKTGHQGHPEEETEAGQDRLFHDMANRPPVLFYDEIAQEFLGTPSGSKCILAPRDAPGPEI